MNKQEANRLANALEALAENIHGNTQEMKVLRESIDDFRIEFEHVVRNGKVQAIAISEGPAGSNGIPESVSCCHCDASCNSLQEAVTEGWLDLAQDEGLSWNFLGICPSCAREEMEADMDRQRRAKEAEARVEQKELFGSELAPPPGPNPESPAK